MTTAHATVPEDPAALIALILTRYHAVHRAELPGLIRLAREVEAAHRHHPAVPHGLAALLDRMRGDLEAHMQKEEEGLFPAMREDQPVLPAAIEIMRDDHDSHALNLHRLQSLTRDHTAPAEAGENWRRLCAGTRKLVDDLAEHIRLENDLLFPRFEA